jgi:hypothetical protein
MWYIEMNLTHAMSGTITATTTNIPSTITADITIYTTAYIITATSSTTTTTTTTTITTTYYRLTTIIVTTTTTAHLTRFVHYLLWLDSLCFSRKIENNYYYQLQT